MSTRTLRQASTGWWVRKGDIIILLDVRRESVRNSSLEGLELEWDQPKTGKQVYDAAAAVAYARKFWNKPCSDQRIAPDLNQHPELAKRGFIDASGITKFVKRPGQQAEDAVDAAGHLAPQGDWSFLDDCTHFISCCIGRPPKGPLPSNATSRQINQWRADVHAAGGLPLPTHSLDISMYGLSGVDRLVEFLTAPSRKWAKILAEKVSKDRARPLIGQMLAGDLIAYAGPRDGRYDHLVIILGGADGKINGKVACHTYCRSDDRQCTWDNDWDAIKPPLSDYSVTLLQMPR
jgi:hypothetical protein